MMLPLFNRRCLKKDMKLMLLVVAQTTYVSNVKESYESISLMINEFQHSQKYLYLSLRT